MKVEKKVILSFVFFLTSFLIQAQGYQIGSIVKDFKLLDVKGNNVSLANYNSSKGLIIVFTSNNCPFSKLYEERLTEINLKYEKLGYPLIAINANDPGKQPEDSFENMKLKAKEKQFGFPYLYDEDQKVASLFNPSKTPQAFIISKENNLHKLAYSGAIDDNPSNASDVKAKPLETALTELLQGKKITTSTSKPVGCTVKWKKLNY